ncbi:MAG: hypothetical protein IJ628_05310 [Bacteroidaceae bacterium]|nr:hypothetical protein [Bacteroidaceae bacterium]
MLLFPAVMARGKHPPCNPLPEKAVAEPDGCATALSYPCSSSADGGSNLTIDATAKR